MAQPTTHIATIHWRDPRWIDVQRRYLEAHVGGPFATYACAGHVDASYHSRFDYCVDRRDGILENFTHLTEVINAAAAEDDYLVFMHGDTFPIADLEPLRGLLEAYPLVAVQRSENVGEPFPHPCFCATTVGFWKEIEADWARGPAWMTSVGRIAREMGCELLRKLIESGSEWYPLRRTNRRDIHPLWFGVYGDLVYHHGAAFRSPISRVDAATAPPRHRPLARYRAMRRIASQNGRLSGEVFERITADRRFYSEFSGRPLLSVSAK